MTTTRVDGKSVSPREVLKEREKQPATEEEAEVDTRKRKERDEAAVGEDEGPSDEGSSKRAKAWKPELKLSRDKVVMEDHSVLQRGVAVALTRALNLPADIERHQKLNSWDLMLGAYAKLIEGIQMTSTSLDNCFTRAEKLSKDRDAAVSAKADAEEALKQSEAELSEKMATLEEAEVRLTEEREARRREAHETSVKIQEMETVNSENLRLLEESRRVAAEERSLREKAETEARDMETKLAGREEELKEALSVKDGIVAILVDRGAEGASEEDIDDLLFKEWRKGMTEAQAADRAELPRTRRSDFYGGWIAGVRAMGAIEPHPLLAGPPLDILPDLETDVVTYPPLSDEEDDDDGDESSEVPEVTERDGPEVPDEGRQEP